MDLFWTSVRWRLIEECGWAAVPALNYDVGGHDVKRIGRLKKAVGSKALVYDWNASGGYALEAVAPVLVAAVRAEDGVLDNGLVRVVLHADGTLDLHDLVQGRDFTGLNLLEDEADRGDEYDFCPLPGTMSRCAHAVGPVRGRSLGLEAEATVEVSIDLPHGALRSVLFR